MRTPDLIWGMVEGALAEDRRVQRVRPASAQRPPGSLDRQLQMRRSVVRRTLDTNVKQQRLRVRQTVVRTDGDGHRRIFRT